MFYLSYLIINFNLHRNISSNLRESYHCIYFFKSRALPIHLCTTTAPLRNLVQPSTCAPLPITYTSRAPQVDLSCTSNHCCGTSRSLAVGTSYSCTSRALLNLVHYSILCTTQSRAPHIRAPLVHLLCTNLSRAPLMHLQSLSWDFPLPDRRHSYSCTSRAPIAFVQQSCSCTHHQATRCPI